MTNVRDRTAKEASTTEVVPHDAQTVEIRRTTARFANRGTAWADHAGEHAETRTETLEPLLSPT